YRLAAPAGPAKAAHLGISRRAVAADDGGRVPGSGAGTDLFDAFPDPIGRRAAFRLLHSSHQHRGPQRYHSGLSLLWETLALPRPGAGRGSAFASPARNTACPLR